MPHAFANVSDVFARMANTPARLGFGSSNMMFDAWQAELRERLVDLLRLPVLPTEPPLVETITVEDCGGYIREKIVMKAQDGLGVPAYLLRPARQNGPRPAILAIHGHGPGKCIPVGMPPSGYDVTQITEGQRDYALQAVRQGMVVLAPDLRGFGDLMLEDETSRRNGNSCIQLACRAIQTGRTLLGMRVADLMQYVDWLESRNDVDPRRICATGQSGGGTAVLYLSALDGRIMATVPSCCFCTFRQSVLAIDHCACNYIPDLSTYAEMHDIAGLIAPRLLLLIAGRDDELFPLDGTQAAFAELEKIYAAAGARHNLQLYVGEGGHRYFSAPVWPLLSQKMALPL